MGEERGPNIHDPLWQREMEVGPFGLKGAQLAAAAGATKIGLSVHEIAPGRRNMPYHAHHGIEELIIVLRGRPILRTPEGERVLEEGEVVACPPGDSGAHQLINEGPDPVRVAIASSTADADFVMYPDSGKLAAMSGEWGTEEAFNLMLSTEQPLDYLDGEI